MSIGDIKVPQQIKPSELKTTTTTTPRETNLNPTPARESGLGDRKSLAEIAQAKHTAYRRGGLLSLPPEIENFLKGQNIHYRWVANKPTRLSDMRIGRGYEFLHESHLPPKLQTLMVGFKSPDGVYLTPAADLILMVLGQNRADELLAQKAQAAEDQITANASKLSENKAFYDKSTTRVEVGKLRPTAKGKAVEPQGNDSSGSIGDING